ncbi:MAG: MraY family glycosyltransferase [Planctomycetota bacterium]|nr:MraY family glycosyltransferase [Planctomycetota bacterium]
MELIALAAAAAACLAALVLTPLVRAVALKIGFMDQPGERKIHTSPVAYGGGIAVALALVAGVAASVPLAQATLTLSSDPEDLRGTTLLVVALGALGALALGLVDDKRRLSPWMKLAVQVVLAIGAVAGGARITAFVGDYWFMRVATVLWIVLITNSLNLLDNMDGLCAGATAISAGILGFLAMENGQWALTLALAALAGACLGFFRYNRSPARIFLGDAGSLFVGYLLACSTVLVTYYRRGQPSHLAIGIPFLILAIPLYDTFSVMLIRIREHRPIMRGDTSHFSHRLVDLGMNRRQAVMTIHLACLAIGLPATTLRWLPETHGFLIIGQALLVLTIVALLEHAGRTRAESHGQDARAANEHHSPQELRK